MTKVFKINPDSPDKNIIDFAAALLKDGGLVAFPTETVYGIGANFLDKKATKRLYEIKKRPLSKPFTVHIASLGMIEKLGCEITAFAGELIKEFWPGPLTIILPCPDASAGQGKRMGFRMPSNRIAKELISKSGVPVAAPSANMSDEKPATCAEEVLRSMQDSVDLVLDGGKTEFGAESTIVDASQDPYRILRKGAIAEEKIEAVWAKLV